MIQSPVLAYSTFSQLLQRQPPLGPLPLMTSPPGLRPPASPASPGQQQQGGGARPGLSMHVPPGMFLASSLLQHLQHPPLAPLPQMPQMSPPSPGSTSSVSPSPSTSPPTTMSALGHGAKSFTIDAILGLSGSHGLHGAQHQQGTPLAGHAGHAGHYLHYPMPEAPSSPTDLSLATTQQQHSPRRANLGPDAGVSAAKKSNQGSQGSHGSQGVGGGGGGGGGGKCKRVRTIFTADQLERLEAEFERQQYMVGPERLYLAHALSLTEAQVKVWFQNRRIKWRKQHLEFEQQRLAANKQNPNPLHGLSGLPPQLSLPQQQLQHHHLHHHEDSGHSGHSGHLGPHRDLDSASEDSTLSEDRPYFASSLVHGGGPPSPPTPEPADAATDEDVGSPSPPPTPIPQGAPS